MSRKTRIGRAAATLGLLLVIARVALEIFDLPGSGSNTLIFAGVVFALVGVALIQHDKKTGA